MPIRDEGVMKKAPGPDEARFCRLIVWGMAELHLFLF